MPGEDLTAGVPTPLPPVAIVADSTATISADALTPDSVSYSGPSKWSTDQQGSNYYTRYKITTKMDTNFGVVQMPVARSTGATQSAIVQLTSPYSRKTVEWYAERIGAKPILPHWNTGNSNEIVAFTTIGVYSTTIMPDGMTELWSCSGLYIYHLITPVTSPARYFCGTVPASNLPSSLQVIDGSLFSTAILAAV